MRPLPVAALIVIASSFAAGCTAGKDVKDPSGEVDDTGVDPSDRDGDGYPAPDDCDDDDPEVYPGADEHCDGKDNDCNGVVDDDYAVDAPTWYRDHDGDGFGDPSEAVVSCEAPDEYVMNGLDCDDDDDTIFPGADELCNGVDNDCDGIADNRVAAFVASTASGGGDGSYESPFRRPSEAVDAGFTCIRVAGGEYQDKVTISGAMNMLGVDGAQDTVISAGGAGRALYLSGGTTETTLIQGFTLSDGYLDQGAGVRIQDGGATLEDIIIMRNESPGSGGGLYAQSADLVLHDVTISSNSAASVGGGLYLYDTRLEFDHLYLEGNSAQSTYSYSYGGGGAVLYGTFQGTQLATTGNSAQYGGGIYVTDSTLDLDGVYMADNSAEYGGSLAAWYSEIKAAGVEIERSYAEYYGGALYLSWAGLDVSDISLSDNSAYYGGGLYFNESSVYADRASLTDNYGYYGGAVYMPTGSHFSCTTCSLTRNSSGYYGGGIWASSSDLELTHTLFDENYGNYGGAIALRGDTSMSMTNCLMVENFASAYAGAIHSQSYGRLNITNTTLVGHDDQAAIYHSNSSTGESNLVIHNSIIAHTYGYGVYAYPSGSGTITYSDLWDNGSGVTGVTLDANTLYDDPLFQSYSPGAGDNNFQLQAGSPCIDAGDPSITDPDGSRSDMGAYGGPSGSW